MGISKSTTKAMKEACMRMLASNVFELDVKTENAEFTVNASCEDKHTSEFLRKHRMRLMLDCMEELGFDIEGYLKQKKMKES